jgi:hypothetical protein
MHHLTRQKLRPRRPANGGTSRNLRSWRHAQGWFLNFHSLEIFAQMKQPRPAWGKAGLFQGEMGIVLREKGLLNILNRESGHLF